MKRILIFLAMSLFVSVHAKALQAVVMHNIFYTPQLQPYLEVYWQIDPQSVLFNKDSEKKQWQAKIRTDIIISNDTGITNEEHYILQTAPINEGRLIATQKIIDLRRFSLTPGKFKIQIKFNDLTKNNNELVYHDSFSVAANTGVPLFSDIQLIDTSIASVEESIFQRNNHLQIPLCTNFLDEQRKTLHYYAELYNPNIIKGNEPLSIKTFISKKEFERPINQLIHEDTVRKTTLQIEEGKFSVATLPSGNYYLNIVLEDKFEKKLASKSLFFQLLNSKPEALPATAKTTEDTSGEISTIKTLNLNKTFVAKYNAAQIRAILKMLLPIAEPTERNAINNFLKRPDEMYMRYFIYNFWLNRDKTNPEKTWKNYTEKIKEVNKLFGSSMLPGYETDRGIVYIKYGKPTERIIVSNEEGALPYEVWQYNAVEKSSNAVFLFYKPGFVSNDYKILHTTVNGEIRNRSWRSSLYINGVAGDANNSRAEQYLNNR